MVLLASFSHSFFSLPLSRPFSPIASFPFHPFILSSFPSLGFLPWICKTTLLITSVEWFSEEETRMHAYTTKKHNTRMDRVVTALHRKNRGSAPTFPHSSWSCGYRNGRVGPLARARGDNRQIGKFIWAITHPGRVLFDFSSTRPHVGTHNQHMDHQVKK